MEDTPINIPPAPSNPTPQNTGYQQYLDPNHKPRNNRKLILLIAGGTLLILAIAAISVFALNKTSKKPNDNKQVQTAEACSDKNCFETRFFQCSPAEYTYVEPESSIKYTIKSKGEIGCNIEVTYVKSQYVPDEEGKTMACEFDNDIDFQASARNVFNFPDDYSCTGELTGLFQSDSNASSSTQ